MTRRPDGLLSLGAGIIAVLAFMLGQIAAAVAPPAESGVCTPAPPFALSLAQAATAAASATPAATPALPNVAATPVAASPTPAPVSIAALPQLVRADDPPADHDLRLVQGSALPLVIPPPCQVPFDQRRRNPCVTLLPPAGSLCVSGAVGDGRLDPQAPPIFAFEAGRVVLRDAQGNIVLDQVQGYFRLDDAPLGLELICPTITELQEVGPDARLLTAQCTNRGEEGWTLSGQVTDGALAAADSLGLEVNGPGGVRVPIVGSLARGAIIVRTPPQPGG